MAALIRSKAIPLPERKTTLAPDYDPEPLVHFLTLETPYSGRLGPLWLLTSPLLSLYIKRMSSKTNGRVEYRNKKQELGTREGVKEKR
jgi:hypothetical protein